MNQMKRILKFIFFPAIFSWSLLSFGQTIPGKLSLQQAVDIAIKNNIQIRQTELRMESADINRKQAKAFLLPNLNGNFNYGWNNGRNIDPVTNTFINQQLTGSNIGVSGQWNVFNGLQIQNSIKQNTLAYNASKMDLQQAKENLTLNVIMNYLQVLNNEDLLVNTNNQALVTRGQVERLTVLVKEGAVGTYLLADLNGQLANDEILIINSANALDLSKLNLCQLLNIPYNNALKLERYEAMMPAAIYPGNTEEIFAIAKKNLAIVKASDLRIMSAEKAVKVEQSAFFPQIGLYANLFSNYSSAAVLYSATDITNVQTKDFVLLNNIKNPVISPQQNYSSENIRYGKQMSNNIGSNFGVAAQIPLFNNLRTKYRVDQARVNVKAAEYEKDNIELLLKQNVEQAYANMTASYKRYNAFLVQYNNYLESFRANEIRFNAGAINSVEYITAKNNLDRATINLAQVRYEYIFRTKILDYFQGKLTL
jgi:outer membrane protein